MVSLFWLLLGPTARAAPLVVELDPAFVAAAPASVRAGTQAVASLRLRSTADHPLLLVDLRGTSALDWRRDLVEPIEGSLTFDPEQQVYTHDPLADGLVRDSLAPNNTDRANADPDSPDRAPHAGARPSAKAGAGLLLPGEEVILPYPLRLPVGSPTEDGWAVTVKLQVELHVLDPESPVAVYMPDGEPERAAVSSWVLATPRVVEATRPFPIFQRRFVAQLGGDQKLRTLEQTFELAVDGSHCTLEARAAEAAGMAVFYARRFGVWLVAANGRNGSPAVMGETLPELPTGWSFDALLALDSQSTLPIPMTVDPTIDIASVLLPNEIGEGRTLLYPDDVPTFEKFVSATGLEVDVLREGEQLGYLELVVKP